ncbi:MAG TPA: hypothetical protein EYO22_03810 [Candidatus Poseidoniales archaeon]|nr:hypothetical protein [Candidatus Poseidoniales archaeon]
MSAVWPRVNIGLYVEGYGRWGVQTSDQHLAVIRAAHALMAAGDNEAALTLLAAFASPGVDAQC